MSRVTESKKLTRAHLLKGKTIARVDLELWREGFMRCSHVARMEFTDGTSLTFRAVPFEDGLAVGAMLHPAPVEAHGAICETDPCERCESEGKVKP